MEQTKDMRDHFETSIVILVAASLLLPLVTVEKVSIPTLTGKVFFFQTLMLFLAGSYALLLLRNWQRYYPRPTPLTLAILLWGASLGISTLFSVDWYRSLWSTDIRMTGVFLIAQFILFYLITSAVIREWKDWKILFRLFLGVGIAVVFLGLVLQAGEDRVSSTVGNATFFAGFTLFLVFLGVFLAFHERKTYWLLFSLFGVVTALFGLFASGTRGALVGLFFGLGFAVFWYIFSMVRKRIHRIILIGLFGFILFAAFVALLFSVFERNNPETTLSTRLLAWEAGFRAWQDKPLFGWGPSNFSYAFNAHYPPEILQYGIPETWFDVAHNVLFDTLATQGFFGFATYLGIFGAAGFMLLRGWQEKIFDIHVIAIGGGLLVSYFVQNLFLFDTPTSYLFFFFFLAFLNSQYVQTTSGIISLQSVKRNILPYGIAISLILVLLFILSVIPQISDELLVAAQDKLKENSQDALALYERAKQLHSPYFRSASVSFLWEAVNSLPKVYEKSEADARTLFLLVRKETEMLRQSHPLEVWFTPLALRLYQNWMVVEPREDFRKEMEQLLRDGLQKSPGRQEFEYELALIKFEQNKSKEAISFLEGMRSADVGIQKGWSLLICTYPSSAKAKAVMNNALQNGELDDEEKVIVQKILEPC